jgi:hypothetical protein
LAAPSSWSRFLLQRQTEGLGLGPPLTSHGGGLLYQEPDGTVVSIPDFSFNNAWGGTVEVGWWFLALKYNFIKYSFDGTHTNANSIGLMFTYAFDFWR